MKVRSLSLSGFVFMGYLGVFMAVGGEDTVSEFYLLILGIGISLLVFALVVYSSSRLISGLKDILNQIASALF